MKIHTSDKLIAYLTLLSGLTISAVAVYYSVAGLVSIFAAAAIPIIVMGSALEISKLVATVWLKLNWKRAPVFIRSYLLAAIAVLMVIISMGIFGFLSKAHSDQSIVSGDVQSKIAIYDEKIKTEKENIDAARKALAQMDASVNETLSRSTSEQGADKATSIRRSQAKERANLQKEIATAQSNIVKLQDERAPIAAEVRAVEAEVGPIKYIAAFVYGDNPDANVLEKAVTWVIIIIVSVFDPLAVILLLASQYSFQWFRQAEDEQEKVKETEVTDTPVEELTEVGYDTGGYGENEFTEDDYDEMNIPIEDYGNCPKCNTKLSYAAGIGPYCPNPKCDVVDGIDLVQAEESKKSEPPKDPTWAFFPEESKEDTTLTEDEKKSLTLKEAKRLWKEANPNETIHQYNKMKEMGLIDKLPWEDEPSQLDDVERPGDYVLWPDESKKKDNIVDGKRGTESSQENSGIISDYVQNEEQNSTSIWQRLKKSKDE